MIKHVPKSQKREVMAPPHICVPNTHKNCEMTHKNRGHAPSWCIETYIWIHCFWLMYMTNSNYQLQRSNLAKCLAKWKLVIFMYPLENEKWPQQIWSGGHFVPQFGKLAATLGSIRCICFMGFFFSIFRSHEDDDQVRLCPTCGKEFRKKKDLYAHMRRHTNPKRFPLSKVSQGIQISKYVLIFRFKELSTVRARIIGTTDTRENSC